MSLIKCNECENQVSTFAKSCPKCGAPVNGSSKPESTEKAKANNSSKMAISVLAALVLIVFVFPKYMEIRNSEDSVNAALSRIKNLPKLPIDVGYRKALMGAGLVGQFRNNSNRFLAVIVSVYNPSINQRKKFRLDISPNEMKEIGHMEGWTFSSGDIITVSHDEYQTAELKMP